MTGLERRYRCVLRALPRWYRAERAEEMVAAFLADRDDEFWMEYSWPGWAETWAVLVLAVRTRLAGSAAPRRVIALGDVVRGVALLGLLAHAVVAAAWLAAVLPAAMRPGDATSEQILQMTLDLGWTLSVLATFAALMRGRRDLARKAALVAILPGLIGLVRTIAQERSWMGPALVLAQVIPLWLCVVCVFAGFHGHARMPAERPWWRAAVAGAVVAVVWTAARVLLPGQPWYLPLIGDLGALPAWGTVIGGLVYLAARRRWAVDPVGTWALAAAGCAVMFLPDRLAFLALAVQTRNDPLAAPHLPLASTAVQVIGMVGVGAVLAAVGVGRLRRLSVTAPPPAGEPRAA
jgi:hypothetical protein